MKNYFKKKNINDDLKYVVPIEEFFDIISESRQAIGHGGRNKMRYYLNKKYIFLCIAVEILATMCTICDGKKRQKNAGLAVKPITIKDFNVRGQVD